MKPLPIGWISLGRPSAKRWLVVAGIAIAILLLIGVMLSIGVQGRPPAAVMQTFGLMSALPVAAENYKEEYGRPVPLDPAKLLAVIRGENVDGLNPKGIVFLELNPARFNAHGELLDGWKRPYLWETPPEGQLAIWSRGRFGWSNRETAMRDGYYQVLIE